MKRRSLLLSSTASLLPLSAMAAARAKTDELPMQDATGLAAALSAGTLRSEQLVVACLKRIGAIDRAGPRINSIIELNPEATAIARALDAERKAGRVRGPLHGLPVLLKDNVATGDKMSTSAGSLALDGVRATRDAFLVKRLREAGAVVLGKTNLSEWANIRSTRSTSGWSARGGLTRNPHALDRNTSGSSSGTGAAIAAGLAPLGVGTETDGSIVSPASICGIVGLKPTVGRISRDGIIPISHTQDTAGPMTRSVADCALLYAAMTGPDAADAVTQKAPAPDEQPLRADALKGARIGVAKAYLTGYDEADALFGAAVKQLQALGAEIVEDAGLPSAAAYGDAELTVLLAELKPGLAAWLKSFAPQAPVKDLAEVIAFNLKHREREMPFFAQEMFEKAMGMPALDSAEYREALAACIKGARTEGLDKAFETHKLDAIVAPTGGLAWLTDPVNADHYGGSFSTPAAVAGYPHLTVPCGFVRGLPLGLSFVGRAWSEWPLLGYGFAYEQATKARRAPRFTARSVAI